MEEPKYTEGCLFDQPIQKTPKAKPIATIPKMAKFFKKEVFPGGYAHYLGNKELYLQVEKEKQQGIFQLIGNIGAACTDSYDPISTNYIVFDIKDIEELKAGIINDFVKSFLDKCPKPKKGLLSFSYIDKGELVQFLKRRAIEAEDNISLDIIEKYHI